MATFEQYKSRVQQRGDTARKRDLYYEKRHLKERAIESLSCKDVLINGVAQKIVIDHGTLPYYKEIKSLPDESFEAGQLIQHGNSIQLIVSCDWDGEVYTYGKTQQCNYYLKWQNKEGEIIERWSVVLSASKYNNGQLYNNVVVVGSNQLMVYLPNDSETLKLGANKRLFVDFNTTNPKCYDITRVDTVTMSYDGVAEPSYDGKGCVLLVLTETEANPDVDRIDLMLCDYVDPNSIRPTSPIVISYSGNADVRIGNRKIFYVTEAVAFDLVVSSEWADKITLTILNDTSCQVNVALDTNLVGGLFKLVAAGSGRRSELLVSIKGVV